MTSHQFGDVWNEICGFYDWEPEPIHRRIWWQAFQRVSVERFRVGADRLMDGWKPEFGVKHPHPEDLREVLPPPEPEPDGPAPPKLSPEEQARNQRRVDILLDFMLRRISRDQATEALATEGLDLESILPGEELPQ